MNPLLRNANVHTTLRRFISLAVVFAAGLAPLTASAAWWDKAWTERATITLNTSAGGVPTQEAVTNTVVPVRLHPGNFDFAAAKEDGSDLRVLAADDKTPLRFTVERFDSVGELAVLWVRLPSVLPATDKNQIHVYAGNPKAPPAEPGGDLFAPDALLTLHFGEKEGPALDSGGALKSDAAILREANGLLGTSAKLAGAPIVFNAPDRLKLPAGGALTLSLWIKPDNPAKGVLLDWGPLKLLLNNGQVGVDVAGARFSGGNLPPNTWAQVVLVLGAGKATLYINGSMASQSSAELQRPPLPGTLSIGAAYAGLVDELQIVPAARSADAIRLAAAAQGADPKLVASVKESADAPAAESGGGGYLGILLKNLTTDAWVVIAILMVMFVVAAWVMVTKAVFIGRTDRDNRGFLQRFRDAKADLLTVDAKGHANSSLQRLYQAGLNELTKRNVGQGGPGLSGASLDAVKAAVDADMVRETHRLNAQMVLLTIAISGGPFLGLLGTVVGVMITFAAIAAAGDVNVNAIAPGIAAALLATVAGLAVAIPALFGYNYLASRIKNISADMQIFVDEFVSRVAETYGQR